MPQGQRRFNVRYGAAVVTEVMEDGSERPFSRIEGVEFTGLSYDKLHALEGLALQLATAAHAAVAPEPAPKGKK